MLALLVLSVVMGVSYASASRSIKGSQEAQERTSGSQLAQSMIEVVKTYAERSMDIPALGTRIFPVADDEFCVATDLASVKVSTPPVDTTSPICTQGIYKTKINAHHVVPSNPEEYEYTATVTWDSATGRGNSQVIMRYKWIKVRR